MSFLDESATLQDALAFLDAYDGLSYEDTSATSVGEDSSSMGTPSSPEPEPQRKTRAKTTAAPKMRHRDRVKAELLRLRHEAEALEATLMTLKARPQARGDMELALRRRSPSTAANTVSANKLMELAVGEYRSRRRSEITNRKLKSLLAKQLKMVKASEGFFHHKMADEDLAVLYESQRAMDVPNQVLEDVYIRDALSARVHQLKLDADKHTTDSGLAFEENFMFRSQRKIDKTLGPVYETVSNTPLIKTMEHTDFVFWNGFMSNLLNSESTQKTVPGEDFTSAHVTLMQFGPDEYERKTRATLLKEVRSDRIIYIWSSWTPFPSKAMNCVEDLMITVRHASTAAAPSQTDPLSLLQIWYRVHANQRNTPLASSSNVLDPHKESMLRSQSGRIGGFIQVIEAGLLDESHGKEWQSMPAICPASAKAT